MPLLTPYLYNISPEYFHAAGTALLAGRTFTWHDDKNAPRVAVVNREFARRIFGSVDQRNGQIFQDAGWNAHPSGGHCRRRKISRTSPKIQQPAMFLPILQSPSSADVAGGALEPRSAATGGGHTEQTAGPGSQGCRSTSKRGTSELDVSSVSLRAWRRCRWVCWA